VQLAKFTDLALRVVLGLAQAGGAEGLGAIAAAVGATTDELGPVLDRLSQLDLIKLQRDDPATATLAPWGYDTSIGWLARELEGLDEVVRCDDQDSPCPLAHGCRLRSALRGAQAAFFASLDTITVADMVPGKKSSLGMPTIRAW
jgi:Rrf2 family nitric oxide-sensitive transcriptional repressor